MEATTETMSVRFGLLERLREDKLALLGDLLHCLVTAAYLVSHTHKPEEERMREKRTESKQIGDRGRTRRCWKS